MSDEPEEPRSDSKADKAVFGLCELLGLLFGLPFGEALYNDRTIPWRDYFYLAIAILFAVGGPMMWPWIRTRAWVPESVSRSISRCAADARVWLAVLLILFVYMTGPEIYRRATEFPTSATSSPDEIAEAVVRKLPKVGASVSAQSGAPTTAKPPYINPLHGDLTKWKMLQACDFVAPIAK